MKTTMRMAVLALLAMGLLVLGGCSSYGSGTGTTGTATGTTATTPSTTTGSDTSAGQPTDQNGQGTDQNGQGQNGQDPMAKPPVDCSTVRCAACPTGQHPALTPPDCCRCIPN